MQYALLGLVVVIFVGAGVRTWRDHRATVPLSRETEGQEITFQLRLDHVKVWGSGWATANGAMALIVRTDTFEVSAITASFRAFFGMDYHFRARDTTIELAELPLISFIRKKNFIIVRGQQGNRKTELAINSENYLYDAWVALVRAGAVPIGPPPPITP
jgi:hypothetical protein